MPVVQREKPSIVEKTIKQDRYYGINQYGDHSQLKPGEFRDCVNYKIRAGSQQDFLETRGGSKFLKPADSPEKRDAGTVVARVVVPTSDGDWVITQEGSGLWAQLLDPIQNPAQINDIDNNPADVGDAIVEFVNVGNSVKVFATTGNLVLDYAPTAFTSRQMGMNYPVMPPDPDPSNTGSPGVGMPGAGDWVYGLEKVIQVSGSDLASSSANRKKANGTLCHFLTGELTDNGYSSALIIPYSFLDDLEWTHIRLWRTKNLVGDYSDPANPIDPQGTVGELYEVALITRVEIYNGGVAPIATGAGLPPGNAGVQAGDNGSNIEIDDANNDSVLFDLITLDEMELLPVPAGVSGAFCGDRLFSTDGKYIYYSNRAHTEYQELYDPQALIQIPYNTQPIVKLLTYAFDLFILLSGSTWYLANGNVNVPPSQASPDTGITNKKFAESVNGVGICAITNQRNYFQYMGSDRRWNMTYNGMDLSLNVSTFMDAFIGIPTSVSFCFLKGNLILAATNTSEQPFENGICLVWNISNQKGFSRYEFDWQGGEVHRQFFSFANGTRAGWVEDQAYTIEFDTISETDVIEQGDGDAVDIVATATTWMFQSSGTLEHQKLTVNANIPNTLNCAPYSNGIPWPNKDSASAKPFTFTPEIFQNTPELQDRNYILRFKPQAASGQGPITSGTLFGRTLHYTISTIAPGSIYSMELKVREDSREFIGDPLRNFGILQESPVWNHGVLCQLAFEETSGDNAYDSSGNDRTHVWVPGSSPAGSFSQGSANPPNLGYIVTAGSGSGFVDVNWNGIDYIGDKAGTNSRKLLWKVSTGVVGEDAQTIIIAQGSNGDDRFYRLGLVDDGNAYASVFLELHTSEKASRFEAVLGFDKAKNLAFIVFLTDGGDTCHFYGGPFATNEFFSIPMSIVSTSLSVPDGGHVVLPDSSAQISHFQYEAGGMDLIAAKRWFNYVRLANG